VPRGTNTIKTMKCETCNGTGKVWPLGAMLRVCPDCKGEKVAGAEPTDRFWLKADHQPNYVEVTKEEYVHAEKAAGFHSKFGPDHPATAAFRSGSMSGRTWETAENAGDLPTGPPNPPKGPRPLEVS
jgi:hypothetical protein